MNSSVPAAVSFPESLPHTLARTGIPLAGWDVLSVAEFECLWNYLWCCAADDTTALAREYRGIPEAPPFAFDRVQAEKCMIVPFSVPSAPMPLLRSLRPRRRKTPGSPVPYDPECCYLYVDENYEPAAKNSPEKCGWGLQVVRANVVQGNFAVPFSPVWYVRTLVSSNCRTISQSWLRLFTLWSVYCLSPQVSIS